MSGLAAVIHFQETRERIAEQSRRLRRPFDIRAETRRLEERRKTPIFELLTEEEAARLMEAAPRLMNDR